MPTSSLTGVVKMTKNEVVAIVTAAAKPAGAFWGFETITRPHMNKKSRANALPWAGGEVTIHASFSGKLGVSYENVVNNAKARAGEARDFVAVKPSGKHHVEGSSWLLADDKTGERFYVAVDKVGGKESTIFVGDRPATAEEVADLRANFFSASAKPAAYGVTWRTYNVESIVAIH